MGATSVKSFLRKHKRLFAIAKLIYTKMHHRKSEVITLTRLNDLAEDWLKTLPSDFDLIIGIPKAGLMVGNVIALGFGLPLATPQGFARGEIWRSHDIVEPMQPIKKILLVEETIKEGKQLSAAKQFLMSIDPTLEIKTASLAVMPQAISKVDYYKIVLTGEKPIFLSWDIIKLKVRSVAIDMDGVLCGNPTIEAMANEDNYVKWLQTASPYLIPKYKIDAIITSRHECFREETEAWLLKHGVKFDKLLMLNKQDGYDHTIEQSVEFKVNSLKELKPQWFWESDAEQAKKISKRAKLPVLCIEQMKIYE